MIGQLIGVIIDKKPSQILLDVNGVGYEVDVPLTTFCELPETGVKIVIHTHLVVREDAHQLYGFLQLSDRKLFRDLLKVNGIGARSALSILSGMDANSFVRCILDGDIKLLTQIPGVGKKTAERLVIEMRDRLGKWSEENNVDFGELKPAIKLPPTKQAEADAISALISLGYRLPDATKMVNKVAADGLTSAELIRLSLQGLANN